MLCVGNPFFHWHGWKALYFISLMIIVLDFAVSNGSGTDMAGTGTGKLPLTVLGNFVICCRIFLQYRLSQLSAVSSCHSRHLTKKVKVRVFHRTRYSFRVTDCNNYQ